MNTPQIIYAFWLVGLMLVHRPCFSVWVICGNMMATLAVCGLMDIGAVDRDAATLFMMIVDLVSGVVLATRDGMPRVLAWGYAVTVSLYALNIMFGVSIGATFALVYIVGFAQLGMITIGPRGDNGLRNRRGRGAFRFPAALSHRKPAVSARGVAADISSDGVRS